MELNGFNGKYLSKLLYNIAKKNTTIFLLG